MFQCLYLALGEFIMEIVFNLLSTMKEVETRFPFARSLLHKKFHVGGCANCGYESNETIGEVAAKHSKDVQAMVIALNEGVEDMMKSEITVEEFSDLQQRNAKILIVDVREEWEFEIARIPNSILLTEKNFKQTVDLSKNMDCVVVVCHHGLRSLNATLYLRENGISNAKNLKGGVDAYSAKLDNSILRY
jgi:rhodanese-related sulfurtransferase